jgi:acylphosphatase
MRQRRHVVVTGIVQGVGMRFSCAREAERHGVAGWVRNLPDGTVEAALEGEEEAVEAMLAWLHRGPDGADVTGVDVRTEDPCGQSGFEVRLPGLSGRRGR